MGLESKHKIREEKREEEPCRRDGRGQRDKPNPKGLSQTMGCGYGKEGTDNHRRKKTVLKHPQQRGNNSRIKGGRRAGPPVTRQVKSPQREERTA